MMGVRCSYIALVATLLSLLCLSQLKQANGQFEGLQRGTCTGPNPCQNNGECFDILVFYFCVCTSDYIGPNCENVHPCVSYPCENGGACEASDDGEGRTCTCPRNVAGVDCETVLPCFDEPCLNGGTCSNVLNGEDFECACTEGYEGETCESAIGMQPECGINPAAPASPRYFGGSNATLGKWPWQGYIQFSRGINFGATLIAPQWAVTSAGNIDILSTPSAVEKVVFGDTYQGDDEDRESYYKQFAYVEEIVRYPGANFLLFDGDAMLLKLTEPLEINDYVRPICLPSANVTEGEDYDMCYTTGWGVDENLEPNSYLKEGRATVIDLETCSNAFLDVSGQVLPNENMICSQQENPSDGPCLGDGGNAFACSRDGVWDLVGTISWGYGCGGELPSVNWRTSAFLGFISYTAFEGPEPEFCEPIALVECTSYLPYSETYMNQQEKALHTINTFLEIGGESAYCDLEELQGFLCALSLGQCNPGDEGQMVICREYCENVRDLCSLTNTTMCINLPYGADWSQQWCMRGEDYSCGNQTIYLEPNSPVAVYSPLYPGQYPELRNCRWDILAPEGHVVQVKFRYLNIYPDGDYVTFGKGDPNLLTTIGDRFDGSVAPSIYRSSGNDMWIRFQSNHQDGDIGFGLFVAAIPEEGRECEENDVFCDDRCYPNHIRCDFVVDCLDGTDEIGCNDVSIPEESTIIESPLYPVPGYPPDFDYTWNLEVPEGYRIGLSFSDFDLDSEGDDYLLVGEGRDGEIEDALYHLNGINNSLRILPFASNVWLRLITDDDRYSGRGFRVNATQELEDGGCYEVEFDCGDGICIAWSGTCNGIVDCASGADEENCPVERCEIEDVEIPPEERCNQIRFCLAGEDEIGCDLAQIGETFYFTVPQNETYPYEYISDAALSWIVRAEEGLGFAVKFDKFSTEQDYDLLYIGSTPEDPNQLEQFTGRIPPEPFFIEDNTFFAIFVSDTNKNFGEVTFGVEVVSLDDVFTCEKGNRLNSKQLCDGLWHCPDGSDEIDCDPLLRNKTGSVVTPRFPLSYENNADVTWTFVTEEGLRIAFFPYVFYTETGYDKLRIGSGSNCRESYSTELSGYIGSEEIILSEDNSLCLHFSSDETITTSGIYGHVAALSEEDFVECPENGNIVIGPNICDNGWHCPETGEDEKRDCPLLSAGDVVPQSSPGAPFYPPNSTITTTASWPEGTAGIFEFATFDLEEGKDFLTIGCGFDPDNTSSVIVSLTGSDIPEPVLVECLSGWTKFVSDGAGYNLGYEANLAIVNVTDIRRCSEDGGVVAPSKVCNLYWDCPYTGQDEFDCPLLSEGDEFLHQSPGAPFPYPANSSLVSTASWPYCGAGVFRFDTFDLEEGKDFLTIGCGFDPENASSVIAILTGSDIPEPVVVECLRAWTKFVSDGSGSNYGYIGSLTVVNVADLFCVAPPTDGSPEDFCDYLLNCTAEPGVNTTCSAVTDMPQLVSSPGFPESYPNNLNKVDLFVAPVGYHPVVNITSFAAESLLDTLVIRSPLGPLVTVTGNYPELPIVVTSPHRLLELEFETDFSVVYSGYVYAVSSEELEFCEDGNVLPDDGVCNYLWNCADGSDEQDCEPRPVGTAVNVTSPGYPNTYPNDLELVWTFEGENGTNWAVNVTDLDVEAYFDELRIGFGDDPRATAETTLADLDGSERPEVLFITPGNQLYVTFSSDLSIGGRGFALNITAIPEPCICTLEYDPVCGADGVTYGNLCGLKCVDRNLMYTAGACEDN